MSNYVFQRPGELTPVQEREAVPGECAECGAAELQRYPVLSEGGWFMTVKCQQCLCSASREPWQLLGHVTLLSDALD